MLNLVYRRHTSIVNKSIGSILCSSTFRHTARRHLPFRASNSRGRLVLGLDSNSFVPILIHTNSMAPPHVFKHHTPHILITLRDVRRRCSRSHRLGHTLSRLEITGGHLSNALSIVVDAINSSRLPDLLSAILGRLMKALSTSNTTVCFSRDNNFGLHNISGRLFSDCLPRFLPCNTNVPACILQRSHTYHLSVRRSLRNSETTSNVFVSLSGHSGRLLHIRSVPPCHDRVYLPIFCNARVLNILRIN